MLNSGKKNVRFGATKKINILTLVLSEKKFLNDVSLVEEQLPIPTELPSLISMRFVLFFNL